MSQPILPSSQADGQDFPTPADIAAFRDRIRADQQQIDPETVAAELRRRALAEEHRRAADESRPVLSRSVGADHQAELRRAHPELFRPTPARPCPDEQQALPFGITEGWQPRHAGLEDRALWLRWHHEEACAVRLLSRRVYGYPGHWFPASKTFRLCTKPDCAFCPSYAQPEAIAIKTAGPAVARYIVVVEVATEPGLQRIWDFGAAPAKQIQLLIGYGMREDGTETRTQDLRGLSLILQREDQRPNGKILVGLAPNLPWPDYLPEPMDAVGHLTETWRRATIRDGKRPPRMPAGWG